MNGRADGLLNFPLFTAVNSCRNPNWERPFILREMQQFWEFHSCLLIISSTSSSVQGAYPPFNVRILDGGFLGMGMGRRCNDTSLLGIYQIRKVTYFQVGVC